MVQTRYLTSFIQSDAWQDKKMAFISGPRQVGKTTLGKSLLKNEDNYFNWDDEQFRRLWAQNPSSLITARRSGPILFDEIHKDRRWKSKLKGLFDLYGSRVEILVTGSARLDFYRRSGDSLLGRYYPYRLHPFSVGEREKPLKPHEILEATRPIYSWKDLMRLGGFPTPLFQGSEKKAKRWSRLRLERLLFEDSRDLRAIHDLNALRVLCDLLPTKVGSLLSIHSLREDVGVAYATLRDWIFLLEALYYCFLIRPYSEKISRTLKAEPKLYLFDILQIHQESNRLENLTALHLLKACHFWTDTAQGEFELRFLRNKEKQEVDFVVTKDKKPWLLVECKTNEKKPHPTLIKFARLLKTKLNIQLVQDQTFDQEFPEIKIRIMSYEKFFAGFC